MEIKTVGVVGAGTMGNGIAHVFAKSGYQVVLCDVEQRFVQRALETIAKNLERELAKNKISAQERDSALKRIEGVIDRQTLRGCDLIVEAVTEKFEIKSEVFRELDSICRPEVILASNTSSISTDDQNAGGKTGENPGRGERCSRVCLQPRAYASAE